MSARTEVEHAEAEHAEAEHAEAERTEAERTEAERTDVDRTEAAVADLLATPSDLLAPGARAEIVSDCSAWSEGPVWMPDLGVLRWSDIPNNRIMHWRPETGETTVYREQVGNTNGRTLDNEGRAVQCCNHRRSIERDDGSAVELIADRWAGGRFNSPNDVVVAADGGIWFTDPPYGLRRNPEGLAGREYEGNFVFRYDPVSQVSTPIIRDVEEPNGLAFSPDEGVLYVADSSRVHRADGSGNHCVWAYDIADNGTDPDAPVAAGPRRLFAEISPGVPDGLRVDVQGRVWITSLDAVQVFAPDGRALGRIPLPPTVANLCFGGIDGHDLFIAATTRIYRVRTTTTDATSARLHPGSARASTARPATETHADRTAAAADPRTAERNNR
ncbi:MAG: SMP-30/gluconolactonase/LRE family protein [Subtercola sp.]|nr:SMP-30/gluconolactonase/LRE family protein [Subtercola sp.]